MIATVAEEMAAMLERVFKKITDETVGDDSAMRTKAMEQGPGDYFYDSFYFALNLITHRSITMIDTAGVSSPTAMAIRRNIREIIDEAIELKESVPHNSYFSGLKVIPMSEEDSAELRRLTEEGEDPVEFLKKMLNKHADDDSGGQGGPVH